MQISEIFASKQLAAFPFYAFKRKKKIYFWGNWPKIEM